MRTPVLLVLPFCFPTAAAADWIADVDAGVIYDNNLNNAELERDIRSDSALTASLSVGQVLQLDTDHSLAVTADLKSELYKHHSGMNNLTAGATLSLRRKLGLGAAAPWLRVSASGARLQFDESLRDGWLYRAGAAAGKRFAERWDVQVAYGFEKRTADNARPVIAALPGNVFDLRSHSLSLDLRYSASDTILLFAGYSWRNGDVVSTSVPNAKIFRASTALARDPVFPVGNFAYTLDAISHHAVVGVSVALNSHSSVNLSYARQITYGAGDNNYYKSLFAASYSYSF